MISVPSVATNWISRLSAKAARGNARRFIYKDLATEGTEGTEEMRERLRHLESLLTELWAYVRPVPMAYADGLF